MALGADRRKIFAVFERSSWCRVFRMGGGMIDLIRRWRINSKCRGKRNDWSIIQRRIIRIDRRDLLQIGNQVVQILIAQGRIIIHKNFDSAVRFDAMANGAYPVGVAVGFTDSTIAGGQVGGRNRSEQRIVGKEYTA